MSNLWIMELLVSARDIAKKRDMLRLAEHMDDALLVAASELHDAQVTGGEARHDRGDTAAYRGGPGHGLH